MDGFNVIPIDKDNLKNIEIIDPEQEKVKVEQAKKWSFLFMFSILVLLGVFCYLGFLIFYRVQMLGQIAQYSQAMSEISKNIDIKEMQEFQAMDLSLKVITSQLGNHVVVSDIFSFINKNIRSTLQISEYHLDVREKTVEVGISIVSPSFKELAEQTEKFFQLRESGDIQSFAVTNLTFEQDTKRLKSTIKIILDKQKWNAMNKQASI